MPVNRKKFLLNNFAGNIFVASIHAIKTQEKSQKTASTFVRHLIEHKQKKMYAGSPQTNGFWVLIIFR
jgi:hypothetical protein